MLEFERDGMHRKGWSKPPMPAVVSTVTTSDTEISIEIVVQCTSQGHVDKKFPNQSRMIFFFSIEENQQPRLCQYMCIMTTVKLSSEQCELKSGKKYLCINI